MQRLKFLILALSIVLLSACGFHLQGKKPLAPPLRRLALQAHDPYGTLERSLRQYLQLSHVTIVNTPQDAKTMLVILQDHASQRLLSVSSTQQTRQYLLQVTVTFAVTDTKGRMLIHPQTLTEGRNITIQSNQILGSSNEANLYYQQIRHTLARAIINRLASKQATLAITEAFAKP